MNERIDKLLVEAGAHFGGDGVVYDTFDPKKFAELIIREAANIATINAHQWHPPGRFVLTHFGVEE
jgi:hypothetical protein